MDGFTIHTSAGIAREVYAASIHIAAHSGIVGKNRQGFRCGTVERDCMIIQTGSQKVLIGGAWGSGTSLRVLARYFRKNLAKTPLSAYYV